MPSEMTRVVSIEATSTREVLGVLVTPVVSNEETGEQFGVFHAVVPPGIGIPVHSHPDVEFFFVLEGELQLLRATGCDTETLTIAVNQAGLVPSNALHGFVNAGPDAVRLLITCTRGLEEFLTAAGRPVDAIASPAPPTLEEVERVLSIARKHGQVFPMAS
jgi:mannose-6-phosphate isomerase-like protein (cupin superfamily)